MNDGGSFSKRHGFRAENPPITIWEDAPEDFRYAVLQVAAEDCEVSPSRLREIICRVLRTQPDSSNYSDYPNIWGEVQSLFLRCDWYRVYDVIERIEADLRGPRRRYRSRQNDIAERFKSEVNQLMLEFGIGWKLEEGLVQARGEESFEACLRSAEESVVEANKPTALNELTEAIADVSRRPTPDTSGAIQHAMAALECVARDVAGDPRPTLGKLIQRFPNLFPVPIDNAVEKLWGYASENARHGREGNAPSREEAILVVGISATLVNYLIHKTEQN